MGNYKNNIISNMDNIWCVGFTRIYYQSGLNKNCFFDDFDIYVFCVMLILKGDA